MKLSEIIAHVESDNNKLAFRFEEELYKQYDAKKVGRRVFNYVKRIHNCSDNSAKVILSSSWGKYQILGINLYNICSIGKTVFEYLYDENLQDQTFQVFIDKAVRINEKELMQELDELCKVKHRLMLEYNNSMLQFSEEFKKHIVENRHKYANVVTFIQRYNGAKFFSMNMYNYLLRMLYFYDKLRMGVKR